MDKKRIFLLIGFFIFCIGLGFLIFFVFFKPETRNPPTISGGPGGQKDAFPSASSSVPGGSIATDPDTLPTSAGGEQAPSPGTQGSEAPQIQQIVANNVNGVSARKDSGQPRFYNEQDGKFYRINGSGSVEPLSDQVFFNVQNVTWSPVADESIIEYPDGNNIYYNFSTKKQVTLPKHWDSFSFAPDGNEIAAKSMGYSPENRWLITSDPEGNEIEYIEPLGNNADKVIVDWSPNKQIVAMSLTGEALGADRQELLFVGKNGENFKSTIVEGRGLVTNWSQNGDKLLYSVYNSRNEYKPELWVVNADGDNIGNGRKLLELDTWADKCNFVDNRTAYCGVPVELQKGVGFAPELANYVNDDLYKVDIESGVKTKISLEGSHTIDKIFVGEDSNIYFTDKNQPGIFSVPN